MENKINVLIKIAKALNDHDITWALGGSCLLYLKGITTKFRDIDIQIDAKDIEEAISILSSIAKKIPVEPKEEFTTKVFTRFNCEGIEIDLMSGFAMKQDAIEISFPLNNEKIELFPFKGELLKLDQMENWLSYYKAIKSLERVKKIEEFLQKQK